MALTVAVLAAIALAAGWPPGSVALGVGAAWNPAITMTTLIGWAALERRRRAAASTVVDDEAAFLQGLSSELAAGAPPRAALVAAASRAPRLDLNRAARLAAAGLDADGIAAELGLALPAYGRLAAAAWSLSATAGGPAVGVFEVLAVRAADEGALIRERRALTAQARASAWVVAGLPMALLLGMLVTGRVRPASDPAVGLLLAAGISLQAAGIAVVWWMLRRAT